MYTSTQTITSPNYSEIYHRILEIIYFDPEYEFKDGYKETLNISFTLTNIANNIVFNSKREPNYEYAKEYFKHIMSGKTNVDKLAKINPVVKKFVDSTGLPINFTSQYGPRIKQQLPRVIKLLKENPDTRRAVINILDKDDKVIWDIDTTHEYPCTNTLHFFIRENRLHLLVQMRSNNVVTTICYDVYLFTNLIKHVYDEIKKDFDQLYWGNYHHQISSAHIFKRDERLVQTILKGKR